MFKIIVQRDLVGEDDNWKENQPLFSVFTGMPLLNLWQQ